MALAEQGDEGNVSTFQRDLKAKIQEDDKDSYVEVPEGIMLFAFDKVLNPDIRLGIQS